jgi:hypothetical protein
LYEDCVDEGFARDKGLKLIRLLKLIRVEYVDGTTNDSSTIWFMTNLRLRAAGSTVVIGALVMWLKTSKFFLGFDWLQAVNLRIDWAKMKVVTDEGSVPLVMHMVTVEADYGKKYARVFSEGAFQTLPERRKWDHKIDLVSGHVPLKGRCYLLAA